MIGTTANVGLVDESHHHQEQTGSLSETKRETPATEVVPSPAPRVRTILADTKRLAGLILFPPPTNAYRHEADCCHGKQCTGRRLRHGTGKTR